MIKSFIILMIPITIYMDYRFNRLDKINRMTLEELKTIKSLNKK